MRNSRIGIGILLVGLLLSACGVGLNIKTDAQGNTVVDASLPESVVNSILQKSVVTGDNQNDLLNQIDSVDMKPGLITVTGQRTNPDGTKTPGSFDLSLSAVNGQLKASVSNVKVQGEPVSQATIDQINQRIADDLAKSASSSDKAEITSVSITDTALQFVITIKK